MRQKIRRPMTPAPIITRIGLIFVHIETAKAAANSTQLLQSMKFDGVMSTMAAAPMSPTTAGRSQDIVFSNTLFELSLAYSFTMSIIMMNDGSTTAKVVVSEPSMHMNCDAPASCSTL